MTALSKEIYRFSAIAIKLPMALFTGLEKKIFFFLIYTETERPQIAKTILRKNTAGGITVPDFRLYYRDTVMKKYVTVTETRQID